MNIYNSLNKIITYIEENLENDIDYTKMAQIMACNEYTMKKVFPIITNISIADYIRNRRLSNAGFDIYKDDEKIIDIAIKYKYDNPTSFSRAFEKFHGIKPSNVKSNPERLKIFPKLQFDETINENSNMEYSIIELDEKVLYGKGIKVTFDTIGQKAPIYFAEMLNKYKDKFGEIDYGMTFYEDRFDSDQCEYWIAYEKEVPEFEKVIIPKSKWLQFKIPSQDAKDIQKVSNDFYERFVPSSKFNFRPLPELEYYYDDVTDFLIPIED